MAILTTSQKAPLESTDGPITAGSGYNVGSSASGVAFLDIGEAGEPVYVVAGTPGTATITAVRLSDGATATLDVEVTAAPFSISLGTPVPK